MQSWLDVNEKEVPKTLPEAKKGALEGQIDFFSIVCLPTELGGLPTERDLRSDGGHGEGKEGASPSETGLVLM